ncbi:alanine racemase [soil metagenome]
MSTIDEELTEAGLPALDRFAWVDVDLDVLTANASALSASCSPAALGVVVKADGYGHGLEAAARCAVSGGATWLCVATAGEARRLRTDGYVGRIFVLYSVPAALLEEMGALDVDVTVGSIDDARSVGVCSAHLGKGLRVHVEIDTGMTRGGIRPEDAADVVGALGAPVELAGMWTHLSEPETPDRNRAQLERFERAVHGVRREGIDPGVLHVAASGGLAAAEVTSFDVVRIGLGFYGYRPIANRGPSHEVAPALAVKAHPVRVAEIPTGTGVGYGSEWVAERPSTIATIPVGYADGWSRSTFTGGGGAIVGGTRVSIVGHISSDSMALDVTAAGSVTVDSEVVLLGTQGGQSISADDVANTRATISWEVLQQLSSRLPRVYRTGGRPVAMRGAAGVPLIHGFDPVLVGPY